MVAYTKPQQRKKESKRLRGDGDTIKFMDLRFERGRVVGFVKERRMGVKSQTITRNLGVAFIISKRESKLCDWVGSVIDVA